MRLRNPLWASALAAAACAGSPAGDPQPDPSSPPMVRTEPPGPGYDAAALRASMSPSDWSNLGATLFLERCSQCHDHGGAPSRIVLARNSPDQVIEAIHSGIMAPIAMFMSDRQKLAVADFVSGGQLAPD